VILEFYTSRGISQIRQEETLSRLPKLIYKHKHYRN